VQRVHVVGGGREMEGRGWGVRAVEDLVVVHGVGEGVFALGAPREGG
jgi:hypothetical protein